MRVRYPDAFHEDNATLSEVLLKSSTNARVPLSAVTKLNYVGERNEIARERQRSVVHVTARLEGVDLGSAVAAVKANLAKMPLPAGLSLEYGGLYAEQQQAFRELALVLLAGTIMMFLILVWEFERMTPALACLVAAMSGLAGSFIALYVTGMTLNISSFMGIIMVAGITAKNGILLLDHAEREVGEGRRPREALSDAAKVRLRPIIMTTLATAAGLFPLALAYGRRRQGSAAACDRGDRRTRICDASFNTSGGWHLPDRHAQNDSARVRPVREVEGGIRSDPAPIGSARRSRSCGKPDLRADGAPPARFSTP